MFTSRISHRAKAVTALAGVPAVAAGLWLTTAGPAQAAESSPAVDSAAATQARPNTDSPVLIKAPKYQGKNRIMSIGGDGVVDLKRSKATKSNGLSAEGTWMGLTKVGSKYQIMSLNDSEEINAYCVQQKQSGVLNIAICDDSKSNQRFSFKPAKGGKYTIVGKWGALEVSKRKIYSMPTEHADPALFSVVAKKS